VVGLAWSSSVTCPPTSRVTGPGSLTMANGTVPDVHQGNVATGQVMAIHARNTTTISTATMAMGSGPKTSLRR